MIFQFFVCYFKIEKYDTYIFRAELDNHVHIAYEVFLV